MKIRSTGSEAFWAHLRETNALRDHLDGKVAAVAEPDFSSLFASASSRSVPQPRRLLFRVALSLSALAAGIVVLVVTSPFLGSPTVGPRGSSVVDQVFRSTSHWEAPRTVEAFDAGSFSPVLKSIDEGLSGWDTPFAED